MRALQPQLQMFMTGSDPFLTQSLNELWGHPVEDTALFSSLWAPLSETPMKSRLRGRDSLCLSLSAHPPKPQSGGPKGRGAAELRTTNEAAANYRPGQGWGRIKLAAKAAGES